MQLDILTPEGKLFSGEVHSVKLPGTSGRFEVLRNHAPILSSLEQGTIVAKTSEGEQTFEVSGGIAEVLHNKINVLV